MHKVIEAGDLKPGDRIFNNQAKPPFEWSTVRSVELRDHEWTTGDYHHRGDRYCVAAITLLAKEN